jgi:hypothetical protein
MESGALRFEGASETLRILLADGVIDDAQFQHYSLLLQNELNPIPTEHEDTSTQPVAEGAPEAIPPSEESAAPTPEQAPEETPNIVNRARPSRRTAVTNAPPAFAPTLLNGSDGHSSGDGCAPTEDPRLKKFTNSGPAITRVASGAGARTRSSARSVEQDPCVLQLTKAHSVPGLAGRAPPQRPSVKVRTLFFFFSVPQLHLTFS